MAAFCRVILVGALVLTLGTAGLRAGEAKTEELKAAISANGKMEDKVKQFVINKLLPLCTNAIFVAAIKEQNDKKVSLDEIKKIDEQWQKAEDELPVMKEKLGNAVAKELVRLAGENAALSECFVMDNQGANVGQNALTSDYWQGDEAKWKNSFKDGQGGVDAGEPKFDKSANAVIQQVSLPIFDEKGTVIGAVTFGLDTSKL